MEQPGISNEETKGDVMEAFLGFGWFMEHPDNMYIDSCCSQLEVYGALHKVIAFVYDNWDERSELQLRMK